MNPLTQAVISGLMAGAVYALLAAGLVITFRTSRVLNLAHGESFAVGGIAAAMLAGINMPMPVVLASGMLAATLYAVAVDQLLLKPRRHWPIPSLILITLAAAFLTRGILVVIAGADPLSFQRLFTGRPIRFLGGALPWQGLALIIIGFAAAIAVTVFLLRTDLGKRLRATAENADAAELMGIDSDRMRLVAFAIAGFLGGIGSVLLVPLVSVDFQAGLSMTLRGFIAAALAGMSPGLAVIGGLGLGIGEALVTTYFGALAQDPIIFLALIGIAVWQSRNIRFGGSRRA
jgi:branched-chain amino acid transport system permease protein